MMMTSERILDPTIHSDWERVAIAEVIKHWQANARMECIWRDAKKLTSCLLWLLPESRLGEPSINPLDMSPVERPPNPLSFTDLRMQCERLDVQCQDIFRQYCFGWQYPVDRVDGDHECIVCLDEGWLPITSHGHQSSRVCPYCNATPAASVLLLRDWEVLA